MNISHGEAPSQFAFRAPEPAYHGHKFGHSAGRARLMAKQRRKATGLAPWIEANLALPQGLAAEPGPPTSPAMTALPSMRSCARTASRSKSSSTL
jgi:hypothetical protein